MKKKQELAVYHGFKRNGNIKHYHLLNNLSHLDFSNTFDGYKIYSMYCIIIDTGRVRPN